MTGLPPQSPRRCKMLMIQLPKLKPLMRQKSCTNFIKQGWFRAAGRSAGVLLGTSAVFARSTIACPKLKWTVGQMAHPVEFYSAKDAPGII